MKIQINTHDKIVRIEEPTSLKELFHYLNKFFPKDSWKEFTLETNIINNYNIPPYLPPSYQPYPYLYTSLSD